MTGREHIGRAKEAICEIITKNRDDDNLEPDREKSAVEIGSVCHDIHDASEDGGGVVFDRHPLQSPHVARFRHDELYLRVGPLNIGAEVTPRVRTNPGQNLREVGFRPNKFWVAWYACWVPRPNNFGRRPEIF